MYTTFIFLYEKIEIFYDTLFAHGDTDSRFRILCSVYGFCGMTGGAFLRAPPAVYVLERF